MKKISSSLLILMILLGGSFLVNAQTVTISKTDFGPVQLVNDATYHNYSVNGGRIFITENYVSGGTTFFQTTFDAAGKKLQAGKLEVPVGVFKNGFSVAQVVVLGNKEYALIENINLEEGKNNYFAREVTNGTIATTGTIIASFPCEKLLNSGGTDVAISPNHKKMVSLSWLPGVKDMLPKITLAVFDENLVKEKDATFDFTGDTKRSTFELIVADDGTVYMVKKAMNKIGETMLTIYMWNQTDNTFKEYAINLLDPLYVTSYAYTLTATNDLVVSGVYRKRETVSTGEPKYHGVFYYTLKGKTEDVFSSIPFDLPIENLVARKVLVTESTAFLVSEQYRSVEDPLPTGATARTYIYTISHKSNFVVGMDLAGIKKFQIELAKDFTSKNADQHNFAASFICNNKLTVVYNDDYRKYNELGHGGQIPVLVQITNDGLMQAPVVFKDAMSLGNTLYPVYAVQDAADQLSFLMTTGTLGQLLTLKIAD